jgi:hypothetical protein
MRYGEMKEVSGGHYYCPDYGVTGKLVQARKNEISKTRAG